MLLLICLRGRHDRSNDFSSSCDRRVACKIRKTPLLPEFGIGFRNLLIFEVVKMRFVSSERTKRCRYIRSLVSSSDKWFCANLTRIIDQILTRFGNLVWHAAPCIFATLPESIPRARAIARTSIVSVLLHRHVVCVLTGLSMQYS